MLNAKAYRANTRERQGNKYQEENNGNCSAQRERSPTLHVTSDRSGLPNLLTVTDCLLQVNQQ